MRYRGPLVVSFVPAVAALSLLASGCGGSGRTPGVANVGSSSRATTKPGLAAYSQCMRAHGVPTFPDPDATGGIPKEQVVAAARGNPNTFKAASTACEHLLPNDSFAAPETAQQTRTQLADELSFARCMRSNGISGFPDPTAQAGLSIEMVQAHGIDLRSPQVLRVVQKCLPASHGGLTAAKVRHAIAEAGR
jgi:hypothetical protein